MNDLGLTATFECEISKVGLKVEWYKGDTLIKPSDKYEIVSERTVHRLVIPKAYAEDEASYTVTFKDTEVKSSASLTIHGEFS